MRSILLTSALLLALVTLLAQPQASAAGRGSRRHRMRMQITCSQVKPQAICDSNNGGFELSDGCNVCTCGDQPDKLTCGVKSCPREEDLLDDDAKRRAGRYCSKLARKVQKRLSRFQAKAAAAAESDGQAVSGSEQLWPVKCFKERKLCRVRPGVAFFDGCNRCRCPEEAPQEPGTEAAAVCETANACPEFAGSWRQFRRHCRALGASIEGGRRGDRGAGGGGGRRRRLQRREGEGDSLFQSLLSRF